MKQNVKIGHEIPGKLKIKNCTSIWLTIHEQRVHGNRCTEMSFLKRWIV